MFVQRVNAAGVAEWVVVGDGAGNDAEGAFRILQPYFLGEE